MNGANNPTSPILGHFRLCSFRPDRGDFFIGLLSTEPDVENDTVEVNVVPHGDGGAPDLNGPHHGFKDG